MGLIVQISDLHLLSGGPDYPAIMRELPGALAREQRQRDMRVELMALTGDVFDSAGLDLGAAMAAFAEFKENVSSALGGAVPMVIVPGNHDRRFHGLVGPHRTALFERLAAEFGEQVWVHGNTGHFLASVVPNTHHRVPAWVIAYDSTYLPLGFISAGGALRQEDLLHAAAQIENKRSDWPLIFLLHHHLVPTPLTDIGPVETDALPQALRWLVSQVLPRIISNADREELTMTALGAGTVLSILHTLRRPVIVLHGHKHYANARHLGATRQGQGDVLIVSGGSAGVAQSWFPTTAREAARLWPSFNVLELSPDGVKADVVSFAYRGEALGETRVVPLVAAERDGVRWHPQPVSDEPEKAPERQLENNTLICTLHPSVRHQRWDVHYVRAYDGEPEHAPDSYEDTVDALEDSELLTLNAVTRRGTIDRFPPCQMRLFRGQKAVYRIDGALCRHIDEAHRLFGKRWAPYCWLGVMNRYFSRRLVLEVRTQHPAHLRDAFASETDLGSGSSGPVELSLVEPGRVVVVYENCPARTLVRIHWPMETH